ncbi:MAG: hypothetical protein IT452_13650 [Planctomycetia bacterium]|nr:hypothetical protein [Planctomycetia bacterium]
MGCCKSCDEGKACEGGKAAACATRPDLIIPGPDPAPPGLIEGDPENSGGTTDESHPLIPLALRPARPLPLNDRLKLGNGEATASSALHLEGVSSGSVDLVVFVASSISSVEAILEGGVDGENFSRVASMVLSSTGFARFRFRGIRFRFLRMTYSASGSPGGVAVLATTLNGSRN